MIILSSASLLLASCSADSTGPEGAGNDNKVGPGGGTVVAEGGSVRLIIPAGSVGNETEITIARANSPAPSPRLVAGTAYEFGPDGIRFNQPATLALKYNDAAVPAGAAEERLRLFRQVGTEWVLDSLEATVDVTSNVVTGTIEGFSTHAVLYDSCATIPIVIPATVRGNVGNIDCAYNGRFHEFFSFEVDEDDSAVVAGRFTLSGTGDLRPFVGLTTPGRDQSQVIPLALKSAEVGAAATIAVMGSSDEYQLFVSGSQGTLGDYSLTAEEISPVNSLGCDEVMFIASPIFGSAQVLDDASDCRVKIEYPSNPSVDGKETIEEYYAMRVPAGRTVVITASRTGGEPGFSPFPTLFLGGGEVVQSGDEGATTRTIRYTAAAERWVTLGVSSELVDNGGGLRYTEGTYSLTADLE